MTTPSQLVHPQTDILFPKLLLICQSDTKTRSLEFLIDTGYNGSLIISEATAEMLRAKPIGRTRVNTASGNQITTTICELEIILEYNISQSYIVKALVMPSEQGIVGGALLQKICKENLKHLVFNYVQDRVEFRDIWQVDN